MERELATQLQALGQYIYMYIIVTFLQSGCGCTLGRSGTECCRQFSVEHVTEVRGWCQELTHADMDMAIMGQLHAFLMMSEAAIRTAR